LELRTTGAGEPVSSGPQTVAVLDLGASAMRLVVAETREDGSLRVLEEVSRSVLLGNDTFSEGRIGVATMDAALKALEGFRRIMDSYAVTQYRAVATSAIREASNRDAFLDRVQQRTGITVEAVDGSEENRLTYVAVREALRGHEALESGCALLVEVGGGSADISLLRDGEPAFSGTYALGALRLRQSLASWHGTHEQRMRLLHRHVHNLVDEIQREIPLAEAKHIIALGGDMRIAARRGQGASENALVHTISRDALLAFGEQVAKQDLDALMESESLTLAEAETLAPALLVYCELLRETPAARIIVPETSLRAGLLLDVVRSRAGHGIEDFGKQVLASARALGDKYRYDAVHCTHVARLATQLFDALQDEHGLKPRHRLLLEVAALLHDIGNFVSLRAHHKHTQYLLASSEIFGLSQDDMGVVSNVARYHRRALPQKTHPPYVALDREERVAVNKLAALLRLANALDADHLQKVTAVRVVFEEGVVVLEIEGAGDMTIERLVAQSRTDLFTEAFGRRVALREGTPR
jgi:exopolyphosphatase/guanosine-5'-triphosphate,3'-diphosphate pyrophosphatase